MDGYGKRIRYYDVLRVVSCFLIIFYHYMEELCSQEIITRNQVNRYCANNNFGISTMAVALFFMLSGASLYISTRDKFDVKKFYKRRFEKIIVPFYIVTFIAIFTRVILSKGTYNPMNGIPIWRSIFTIMGIDGWLLGLGIKTFSQGVGEWFLGCLIIIYVIFPLVRLAFMRNKKILFGVVVVTYIIAIALFPQSTIPMNIIVKACEFIFGMYLGLICEKNYWFISLAALGFLVFMSLPAIIIPIKPAVLITLSALLLYLVFSVTEKFLNKHDRVYKVIFKMSAISYELFLTHHLVIYSLTSFLVSKLNGIIGVVVVAFIEIICMLVFSFVLNKFVLCIFKRKRQFVN